MKQNLPKREGGNFKLLAGDLFAAAGSTLSDAGVNIDYKSVPDEHVIMQFDGKPVTYGELKKLSAAQTLQNRQDDAQEGADDEWSIADISGKEGQPRTGPMTGINRNDELVGTFNEPTTDDATETKKNREDRDVRLVQADAAAASIQPKLKSLRGLIKRLRSDNTLTREGIRAEYDKLTNELGYAPASGLVDPAAKPTRKDFENELIGLGTRLKEILDTKEAAAKQVTAPPWEQPKRVEMRDRQGKNATPADTTSPKILAAEAKRTAATRETKTETTVAEKGVTAFAQDVANTIQAKRDQGTVYSRIAADVQRRLGKSGISAAHASPHRHEGRFSWRQHKGKGEGNAAFGAGTYLSTDDGVNASYINQFSPRSKKGLNDTAASLMASADDNVEAAIKKAEESIAYNEQVVERLFATISDGQFKEVKNSEGRSYWVREGADHFRLTIVPKKSLLKTEYVLRAPNDTDQSSVMMVESGTFSSFKEAAAAGSALAYNADMRAVYSREKNIEALKDAIEELKAYTPNQKKEPVTYHVTINATDDEILDWNTPLREQSQRVQDAVDAALPADKEGSWVDGKSAVTGGNVSTRGDFKIFEKDDKFEATHMGSNSKLGRLGKYDSLAEAKKAVRKIATATMTGREVYLVLQKKLGSDVDASIALADAGIVGHKFAASGGRNDTHPNYVIYADERIQTNYVTFGKVDYKSWLEFTPEQRAVYSMLYGDPATANPAGSWAQSDVTGAKLNKLTEAWAGNLGIKAPRVITDKAEAAKFGDTNSLGFYNDKNGVVYINDTYSAEVQLETLAHEVGHGVFRQIKMSGPEAAAIKTAYEAWRAQQAGKTKSQVRASRSTAAVNALVLNENGKAPDWYDLDFEEWFADNVGRWLTTDAKPLTAVDRFFAKIANAIRTLAGFLKTQGYTPSADTAVAALMDKLYGGHNAQSHYATLDDYYSNQPRGVLYNLAIGMQSPGGSATAKQVFQALTPEQRRTVGNAFGQGSARGRLVELLRADGRGAEARMVLSGDTATAWGWGVHYWKKGTLKVGAALDNVITQQETALRKALGTLSEGERANEILTAVVNQNLTAATGAAYGNQGRVQKAAAATMKTIDKLMPLMNFMTVAQERMYATQNPVLIDIANKLAVRTGEAGRGESYVEAQQAQSLKRMNKVATIIEGMSDADKKTTVDALKTGKMPTTLQQAGVMSSLTNWFNDAHAYGSNVDPNLPKIDGYFPVVYDTDKLADKRAEFADMLAEDRFKDALGDLTKLSTTERADPAIRRAKAGQLVDYMVQNMTAEGSTVIQEPTPYFSHGQKRTLDFIRTLGTDADRQLWADVQSDDLLATMNGYTRGLTRRTEYLRRFPVEVDPVTGQVLRRELDVQLNSAAKDYGASAKDIELANDYVSALLGTYGLNDRPKMLTKLTDALDKLGVFGTDWSKNPAKLRKVMGVVMMYQNVRLLALSGLSSVVDFAGIAMRTDLTSAMEGLREGVRQAKAAYQKTGPTGYRQMAETLGVVDKAGLEEAILQTYAAADIGPLARKVNDFLFRWNGLNGLTRAMRVMSLAAAETYVARQMVNTPAARYELQKLNITHDDVRAKNEDYMRALNRLVNEATIRPNAAQRPLWGSHPDFMLVFHLKQFMFSMHDRIIRQMVSQVREGNTVPMQSVVWYGLLGLAVDTISDEIRMGGDDDEEKAKYGWNDYMTAAMERSGLNGMGQVFNDMRKNLLYGGTGVEELTGPTGTQAAQWFRAIFGDGSASSAALSSLPASQLFKGLVNRVD